MSTQCLFDYALRAFQNLFRLDFLTFGLSFSVECYLLVTHRYMEIPVVSRVYLTGAFLTTAACAVDIISPFSLYFNWDLVFSQGQIWRLITR